MTDARKVQAKLRADFFELTGLTSATNAAAFHNFKLGYALGQSQERNAILSDYEFFKNEGKWLADAIRYDAVDL